MAVNYITVYYDDGKSGGSAKFSYIGSTDKAKLNYYFGTPPHFLCFRRNDTTYYVPLQTSGVSKLRVRVGGATHLPVNLPDITCTLSMTFSASSAGVRSAKFNSFKLSSKLYGATNVDIRYNVNATATTSFNSFNLSQGTTSYSTSKSSNLPSSFATGWQCIVTLANGQKETFSWTQSVFPSAGTTVTKTFTISQDKYLA